MDTHHSTLQRSVHASWLPTSGRGFTIVELLIVVVVIAILAAITIVSYNGITARAERAKIAETVSAYQKLFQIYKAQHGEYPNTEAVQTQNCLGNVADYPASGPYGSGICSIESIPAAVNPQLNAQLQEYTSSLPNGSFAPVDVSQASTFKWHVRGIIYEDDVPDLIFFFQGDVSCPIGDKTYHAYSGSTRCTVGLDPFV